MNNQSDFRQARVSHQETTDDYLGVITQLCERHRVIVCRDAVQWIVQRRKNGGAERPWRALVL